MKKLTVLFIVLAIACLFGIASCEKEGPAGPAGEQGAQGEGGPRGAAGTQGAKGDKGDKGDRGATGPRGAAGPRGANGATGPRGATGTANVIYSEWETLYWSPAAPYRATLASPKITQEIMDHGSIMVYTKSNLFNHVYPLPIFDNTTFEIHLSVGRIFIPYPGQGFIRLYSSSLAYSEWKYRFVIIPGGIAASARADGLDFANFEEVSSAFNIPK